MIPSVGQSYTCANSGLIVQVAKIRYRSSEYTKAWLRYFTTSGRSLGIEERNVKLIHSKIQHWIKVDMP